MSERLLMSATVIAALGSALIGGVFFAFSSFVMGALARLPTELGVRAMRAINVVVINPLFLGALLGTALLCAGLAWRAISAWSAPGSGWLLAGALAYIVGTVAVTLIGNVPLNDALAPLPPDSAEAAAAWQHYLRAWTLWNHLRTAAGLAAALALMLALRDIAGGAAPG
jgi:uncharacterized membrane protein